MHAPGDASGGLVVIASDQRQEWIQQYGDGIASAESTARLDAALREDPEFRALFLEYLNLDRGLITAAAVFPGRASEKVTAFPSRDPRPRMRWLAVAAVFVAALVVAKLIFSQGGGPSGTASRESVAVLGRTV